MRTARLVIRPYVPADLPHVQRIQSLPEVTRYLPFGPRDAAEAAAQLERKVRHGVYGKMQRRTTKFMAHDENGTAKAGDTVAIVESRPLSRSKRWVVLRVVEKAQEI
mgnify:CR=1 FL=1